MNLTNDNQTPFVKLIFCIITVFLVTAGCNSSGIGMTTQGQDKIRYILVNYQGVTVRLTIENNSELTNKIFKEISSTKVESHPNPSELESQESSPVFSLVLGYADESKDEILSTETGKFIFRRLAGNGWIGGSNANLKNLIIEVTQGDQISLSSSNSKSAIKFSVFLEKEPNSRNRDKSDINSIQLEEKPVFSDADIPYSWNGDRLTLNEKIVQERLRGKIPLIGRLFVLSINEKRTSMGMFWTLLSSAIPPTNIPVIIFDYPEKDIVIYNRE